MLQAADALDAARDELANLLTIEQGKPIGNATGEVMLCAECLRKTAAAEIPVKRTTIPFVPLSEAHQVEIRRKPIGVIAGITPWNFPMFW